MIKKGFKYLEPLWTGADGKISINRVLALLLTWKLVENLDYGVQKWAADRSLEGLQSLLFVVAGLIAALLGLTAWQNMTSKKIETEAITATNTHSSSITVQKADTVTTATTKTDTLNAEKVDTVNAENVNVEQVHE